MNLIESRVEDIITIAIVGRVDTVTSPDLQNAILKAFQKSNKLILDFEKCEYVSSAGLRALLLGQKTATSKKGFMKLVKVQEIVLSVFEVTGFDSILTIE